MSDSQKRKHFRLEFPPSERPKLKVGKYELVVLDVSEGGCSAEVDHSVATAFAHVGIRVAGTLVFAHGEKIEVEGEVQRVISPGRLAILFLKGPSFAKMMTEHRRIRAKFVT